MVLFVLKFWKIPTKLLDVLFTFIGLVMLGTDLEEVIIQSIANLEKKVSVNPFVAKHLV